MPIVMPSTPVTYEIDPSGDLVYLQVQGAPTFTEWRAAVETAMADPAFRPGSGLLADRRLADPPDHAFMRAVLSFFRLHRKEFAGTRWAMVVQSGSAAYGMGRLAQAYAEGVPIALELFSDIPTAAAWIRSARREADR